MKGKEKMMMEKWDTERESAVIALMEAAVR